MCGWRKNGSAGVRSKSILVDTSQKAWRSTMLTQHLLAVYDVRVVVASGCDFGEWLRDVEASLYSAWLLLSYRVTIRATVGQPAWYDVPAKPQMVCCGYA